MDVDMKNIAVIYHSAQGRTEHVARHVLEGATRVARTEVHLRKAEDLARTPDELLEYDGLILSMFVFCMRHGMLWVGNPILPGQHGGVPYEEAANRLGS
jgi:hypothetical protein